MAWHQSCKVHNYVDSMQHIRVCFTFFSSSSIVHIIYLFLLILDLRNSGSLLCRVFGKPKQENLHKSLSILHLAQVLVSHTHSHTPVLHVLIAKNLFCYKLVLHGRLLRLRRVRWMMISQPPLPCRLRPHLRSPRRGSNLKTNRELASCCLVTKPRSQANAGVPLTTPTLITCTTRPGMRRRSPSWRVS